ncbi:MAG: beta-ketoacyl synthase chain length factor [Halioglobus sp.]|nr:beta-ketoacyl synthase chain length factor [Halioglobus sp.]
MKLTVDSWCSWEAGENQLPVCTHYSLGETIQTRLDVPDLSNVPALQRRRLGSLARIVFHVLDRCAETGANEPVVFSSYMGEIQRTYGILKCIQAQEPVSPGAFSLSVHNAIAGQWSLIRDIEAPMVALSPPSNSPVPALLEAAGILQEGQYCSVNVVFYDEPAPEFFSPFLDRFSAPVALAMRLVGECKSELQSTVNLTLRQHASATISRRLNYQSEMLDLLSGRKAQIIVEEPQCCWQLGVTA